MCAPILAAACAVVNCGSRTGLFVDVESDASVDAPFDVFPPPPDASVDHRDAAVDAPIDATPCIPGTVTMDLALANLMFVLDRSGSMSFALDADVVPFGGLPDRWTTLHDALAQTITPFDQQIKMGAKFFPGVNASATDPTGACVLDPGVDVTPGLGNVSSILQVFTKTGPVGGTPTASALQATASFLAGTRGVVRGIVLATDGQPNCNPTLNGNTCTCTQKDPTVCQSDPTECLDDVATVNIISNVFNTQKIPVYVIGIGPSANSPTLNAMAVAGGRPRAGATKFFPATTSAELVSAFGVVRDGIAKCTYVTPSAPQDPNAISVNIGGKTITRDPTHTDGWDWIDQTFGELQLFGSACDTATATNVSGTVACQDQ